MEARQDRRLTIYRDDSTSQLSYERVKTWFWAAGNTALVISLIHGPERSAHHHIQCQRERSCWFRDEPMSG